MPKKVPSPAEMKAAVEAFKKQFTTGFYHGSPSPNIKEFDPTKSAKDPMYTTPKATFVTRDPEFAESFLSMNNSGKVKSGSTMYPVSVNLGQHWNPGTPEGQEVIQEFIAQYPKRVNLEKGLKRGDWTAIENSDFLEHLKNTGHDTFHVVEGGIPNVGVLKPENIRGKFAEYNPEEAANPDFMKAEGGAVDGYAPGGKVGALAKLARHAHGQDPRVAKALEEYLKGNISQEERIRVMNQFLPTRQWKDLPPNYSDDEIRNALLSNKQPKALAPVPEGMRVGNRLDIPAYTQHGVYVDTTHDDAGKAISYGRTGHLKDVEFSSKPNQAVRVGLGTKEQALTPMGAEIGSAKSPFALIKGTNVGTKDDEVRRMMEEMMQDPRYTQIGMDPRKHSQFYDKETGMPVWAAEEKLQSGPLILAPKQGLETTSWDDPRLNLSDFEGKKYAPGGAVKAAKKMLEHARSVPFVHFSNRADLSYLEPQMYGTGIKGKEAARLQSAPDIKPRSYIYTDRPDVRPEQGLGSHKYSGVAEDMYPLHDDPAGYSSIAKMKAIDPYMMQFGREVIDQPTHLNELERLIKAAGYKGYANDDVGLLFHPTDVKKVGGPEQYADGGSVGTTPLPQGGASNIGIVSPAMGVNPDGTTTPNAPYMPIMGGMTLPINNPAFSSPPNIALPAMGVNPDGTTTPAPPQIWNERTGQYQSQTDTTPGAMPGPIGGLSGLIAGENPEAPVFTGQPYATETPIGTTNPITGQPWGTPATPQNSTTNPMTGKPWETATAGPAPTNGIIQETLMPDGKGNFYDSASTYRPSPVTQTTPPIPQNSGSVTPRLPPSSPVAAATPTAQPMAPQLPPSSPVAAATPGVTGTSYMNLKRPSAAPSVLNQFGTRLNQVRQAPGATPQAPQVNPRANLLSNLARFRKR